VTNPHADKSPVELRALAHELVRQVSWDMALSNKPISAEYELEMEFELLDELLGFSTEPDSDGRGVRRYEHREHVDGRTLYPENVPFFVPDSLADLRGPPRGELSLPKDLYWGPSGPIPLDDLGLIGEFYQPVIRIGDVVDQVTYLNRDILIQVWSKLVLPARNARLWEARFPELATLLDSPE